MIGTLAVVKLLIERGADAGTIPDRGLFGVQPGSDGDARAPDPRPGRRRMGR